MAASLYQQAMALECLTHTNLAAHFSEVRQKQYLN